MGYKYQKEFLIEYKNKKFFACDRPAPFYKN